MLSTPPSTVGQAIISLFTTERELAADEIHRQVSSGFFPCSLRSVYKELRALVERGVMVKIKNRYLLSITWILNLIQFAEQLYSVSVEHKPSVCKLPSEGERMSWRFSDLQHMDRFWIQLMFTLFEHSKSRTMFAWVPHFWFDLIHYEKDQEAQRAMKIAGNKMYMLLGGRTYLDKLPTKYWAKEVYEWSYAVSPFEKHRNRYFDVIDDYILTVNLDDVTTARIGELFNDIKGKADLGRARVFETIKSSAKVRMTLERSAGKALKLRRTCAEFFGIADPCKAHT